MKLIDDNEFARLLKGGLEDRVIFQGEVFVSREKDDMVNFIVWKGSMSLSRHLDGETYELKSFDPKEDRVRPKHYISFIFRRENERTELVSGLITIPIDLGGRAYLKIRPDIDTILY